MNGWEAYAKLMSRLFSSFTAGKVSRRASTRAPKPISFKTCAVCRAAASSRYVRVTTRYAEPSRTTVATYPLLRTRRACVSAAPRSWNRAMLTTYFAATGTCRAGICGFCADRTDGATSSDPATRCWPRSAGMGIRAVARDWTRSSQDGLDASSTTARPLASRDIRRAAEPTEVCWALG